MIYFPFRYYTNLGNWLFQYAAALSTGLPVSGFLQYKPNAEKIRQYPNFFGNLALVDELPKGVIPIEEKEFRYSPFDAFEEGRDYCIEGFCQSEKYFNKELVRKSFRPSSDEIAYLHGKYGDWLSRPHVTGISVRHGKDYLAIPFKHPFVGREYFSKCIGMLPECWDYIVCSDDLEWCEKYFPRAFPDKRFLFVKDEKPIHQLFIHALCCNNIISNSSFSWWGAWLNEHADKKVFAPSEWFGVRARKVEGIDWQDIYAEGMIVVDNNSHGFRLAWQYLMWGWIRFKQTCYPIKRFVTVTLLGGTH